MRKAGLWGLLWMLFVSAALSSSKLTEPQNVGSPISRARWEVSLEKKVLCCPRKEDRNAKLAERGAAAAEPVEKQYDHTEGQTFSTKFYVDRKFANSQKAWQRLENGVPLTLALTERSSDTFSRVQVGRIILEDIPADSLMHVQMTDLRVQDSGLYQCVIDQPQRVNLTFVRLVVTKDSSDAPISSNSNQLSTGLHPTTKAMSLPYTSPRTVTQFSLTLTSGPGVNTKNVTDVTRVSVFSIVVPVVCGLLSKSLVFSILFAVTQRSFGP
ncbi:triggering receptor expressed on myeloid cells 1 [Carlito syrichta]|uniref:Triggering receptor expressed on myeloid cells 1 n=1 Tax=Carlito syrichta TaxID=1868482 RepID=A0A1U7TV63_CARSF|nr:triggering receptor expressed on myeloid cells 1 [Carlito syrichta]